ncbi:hypothetical protein HK100_006046 [Physocladia obscura]|uniref:Uncharacterized protein n=1 Tax=Physocladia obscura TaxID=109957 RepID=A0AAD5SRW5_9FUNG|nr:hypothetical protein HK100_006046 [Physocladia obscura]
MKEPKRLIDDAVRKLDEILASFEEDDILDAYYETQVRQGETESKELKAESVDTQGRIRTKQSIKLRADSPPLPPIPTNNVSTFHTNNSNFYAGVNDRVPILHAPATHRPLPMIRSKSLGATRPPHQHNQQPLITNFGSFMNTTPTTPTTPPVKSSATAIPEITQAAVSATPTATIVYVRPYSPSHTNLRPTIPPRRDSKTKVLLGPTSSPSSSTNADTGAISISTTASTMTSSTPNASASASTATTSAVSIASTPTAFNPTTISALQTQTPATTLITPAPSTSTTGENMRRPYTGTVRPRSSSSLARSAVRTAKSTPTLTDRKLAYEKMVESGVLKSKTGRD